MIEIRKSAERGSSENDWLRSRHSFSFGDYFDPLRTSYRSLRVINEDWVLPRTGFATHAHRDMEILTFPIAGRVAHRDSQGNVSELASGRVQLMSAGTGIEHSEMNPSDEETLHLLQIWLLPEREGLPPSYQEREISATDEALTLLASTEGEGDSLQIHQDARVYRLRLSPGETFSPQLGDGRYGWLQMVEGSLRMGASDLEEGDALAFEADDAVALDAQAPTTALLFDLA